MIDLPAQKVQQPQTTTNRFTNPSELLTQTIRIKYEELKSKPVTKYNMVRSYTPIHSDQYNQCFNEFQELLTNMQEGQPKDINKYLPLIFAALEGSSANTQPEKILIKKFGANIQKLEIDQIIKSGKVKATNYGNDKRRQTNIRQVANKDSFQSMGEFYDLKEIRNHRKICNTIKTYLTSMKNFMDCMKDTDQNDIFGQESIQNVRYIEFANKELGFMKLKIPPQIMGESEQVMVDEAEERKEAMVKTEIHVTPVKKQMPNALSPKEETASGQKDQVQQQQQVKSSGQQNKSKPKQSEQVKQTRPRRTKEEIEKERLERQKEKKMKALEKEEKEKERLMKLQEKQRERLAKEKEREMQKQAKEKLRLQKERERQAKQREKEAEKQAKQDQRLAKQKQKLAKQAAKQAERIAKQKKNSPGQSILSFLKKPTEKQTPIKTQIQNQVIQPDFNTSQQKDKLLSSINKTNIPISQLRNKFLPEKMKDQNTPFRPYYSSVFISRSRLQFDNFLITEQRFSQYFSPHQEYENAKYDDSSIEYQDFCGDFCDEKMDEMSVQEEEDVSENSAIVPDSYVSQDQISSLNQSKDQIRIKIGQGAEWSFSNSNNYTAERYVMFSCFEDEPLPLPLNEPEESKELTINLKCELYKEIHGSYGPKDLLIKKLASIADKVPKSYLDTLIKETTTKRGYQRLVKPQIIDFLTEQRQNFAKQLQEIKSKRDEDNMIEMKGRMNEKQRQIQRLILQQAGTYYIIDMLHFLREKGYRMLKRELKEFIDARTGSQWDDVRKRMNKMQLKGKDKEKEKMTEFLKKKEKEDKEKKEGNQQEKGQQLKEEDPSSKKDQDQNNPDRMQAQ